MMENDHRPDNPYTQMEGYQVSDASGKAVGKVEYTVYDAPSDVLKYVVLNGRPIPAEGIEVDPEEQRVLVPYDAAVVASAPGMEQPSGAFDETIREHYEGRG